MTKPHPPGHLTDKDFPDDHVKWEMLRDAPMVDAREGPIRDLATWLSCAAGHPASEGHARAYCLLAQCWARDVIAYESDTEQFGGEDIAPAGQLSDVLERRIDDCDAKARLFVALCLARPTPLRARMVDHWQGQFLAHVSAEVLLDGKWVPVELSLARARLGEEPRQVPKEVTGHWLLNEPPK